MNVTIFRRNLDENLSECEDAKVSRDLQKFMEFPVIDLSWIFLESGFIISFHDFKFALDHAFTSGLSAGSALHVDPPARTRSLSQV